MAREEGLSVFWFRRDLRFHDNRGLARALQSGHPVLPIFIFDSEILGKLPSRKDARVEFLHNTLGAMATQLKAEGSTLLIESGKPIEVWKKIIAKFPVRAVYTNHDYEPYALDRDEKVRKLLAEKGIVFHTFKDQVIFERLEVTKDNGEPYSVFTPYSRKWKANLKEADLKTEPSEKFEAFVRSKSLSGKLSDAPSLKDLGFEPSGIEFPGTDVKADLLKRYEELRNLPAVRGTSRLGLHLRFGTVSVREMVKLARKTSETWLNELIWREFFMQILANHPHVVSGPYRKEYAKIPWRNNEAEFKRWCEGQTGFPIIDAGMRELNATGFMHNRVRMIVGSFLVKQLLIDWRWGEKYFADKLLDFELASNNGNWQWVAGTGCDAAPYFRVFNPESQEKKFDPKKEYIKKWVPEVGKMGYPAPILDLKVARVRALRAYAQGLGKKAPPEEASED